MKKLSMLLTPLIILSLIFGAVGCAPLEPTPSPTVIDIDFYQMDFNLGGDNITDSSWGAANIVYESYDDEITYINLAINEQWVVQNLPVMPVGNEFVLDFDLGVENGIEVTQLLCACEATTYPLETMPSDFQTATVADRSAVMYSGEIGANVTFSIPGTIGGLIGWLPVDWAWHDKGDISNQPCGVRECVPAAISNSLKFLNKKHSLNMTAGNISIDKMKEATGWDPEGAPFGWWDTKKKYMEDNDYPIETTIYGANNVTLDDIIGEIRSGQGVELRVPGHAAMVVGLMKLLNGNYVFMVAHDTNQGPLDNGEEEIQFSVYDPTTGNFTGGKWINGNRLSRIIVECPTETP